MDSIKFKNTFKVQRGDTSVPAVGGEKAGQKPSSSSGCSTLGVDHLAPSVYKVPSEEDVVKRRQELKKIGHQIQYLIEFTEPKNNVHQEIKKRLSEMSSTYNRLIALEEKVDVGILPPPKSPQMDQITQTSPRCDGSSTTSFEGKKKEEVGKRKDISPLTEEGRKTKKAKRRKKQKLEEVESPVAELRPIQVRQGGRTKKENKWETVQSKKQQRKQRPKPTLPDAVVIQKRGELSYAEILSRVKKDDTLKSFGQSVRKIRRTATGDMIFVLDKAGQESTSQFRAAIGQVLGSEAEVKCRVQHISIEIKDLDETATKEEVREALQAAVGDLHQIDASVVKSLRKGYGETQTAAIVLPAEPAKQVLEAGKLRIGWVVCRVREVIKPTKCYKCWQYGHLSKNCKSTVDRSKCCIKCGEEGHKVDKCTSPPCCVLCKDERKTEESWKHVAGSSKCPAYMKAFQKLMQKR